MEVPLLSLGVFLLALLAGAAVGMNLFLAIKLVRKRITIASGAIAHLGVGLMFVGIVSSSTYDRSTKVTLPQGSVKGVLGYEISFKGPEMSRDGKGQRLHTLLEVKKGDGQFHALPDIYSERGRDGQVKRFVHPHIRRGLISDLYISPVDFDPGEEKDAGSDIVIGKGKKTKFRDFELTFTGFDVSKMMGKEGTHDMTVGANIEASYKGSEPVTLEPVITVGQLHSPSSRVKLPGLEEAYVTLVKIDAGGKTIGLVYEGPQGEEENTTENSPPSVIAEVSIKPGMTVLWLGTLLILVGGGIAIPRRWGK
jgi:cytochrome c-type biogenesis protein CcmF